MKTLIELYDERPLENVRGVEVFRPETVIYVCPGRVAKDRSLQKKLREYGAKVDSLWDQIEAEKRKQTKARRVMWLIKYEYHS